MSHADNFQNAVTRIALEASAHHAFLLSGGKALQAHGLTNRPTQDIDLFTNQNDVESFDQACAKVVEALQRGGFHVEVNHDTSTIGFAQFTVTDRDHELTTALDMGIDWRSDHAGVDLALGPVLSLKDAIVNKTLALFGRGYARDFIDFDSILNSEVFTLDELLDLAKEHDPGFDTRYFAQTLHDAPRIPYAEAEQYEISQRQWETITTRMFHLSLEIMDKCSPESLSPQQRIALQQSRESEENQAPQETWSENHNASSPDL